MALYVKGSKIYYIASETNGDYNVEYDLYSVWINCMTGEIILDDFAKHRLG